MPRFRVDYVAIANCSDVVVADTEEEAIENAKRGLGQTDQLTWDRAHPDTEFDVARLED